MNNILSILSFDDYSALAHGITRNLPKGTAITGSQVLASMAKSKGYKSPQAFKAAFIAEHQQVIKPEFKIENLNNPKTSRKYFIEAIGLMTDDLISAQRCSLSSTIKDWMLLCEGPICEGRTKPTLFNFLHETLAYKKYVIPSSFTIQDHEFITQVDSNVLNEAYDNFSVDALKSISKRIVADDLYDSCNTIMILKESLLLSFNEVSCEFFSEFQIVFVDYIKNNFFQAKTNKLDTVRFVQQADILNNDTIKNSLNLILTKMKLVEIKNTNKTRHQKNSIMSQGTYKDIHSEIMFILNSTSTNQTEKYPDECDKNRISRFLSCVLPALLQKREEGLIIDHDVFKKHLCLDNIEFDSNSSDIQDHHRKALKSYLIEIPGYSVADASIGQISKESYREHGYLIMRLYRVLDTLFINA